MALDIGDALSEGFGRTTKRNALLLMVAVLVVSLASAFTSHTMWEALIEYARTQGVEPPPGGFPEYPLALSIPPLVAGLVFALVWVLQQAVTVVAIRTFVSDHTERIPREFLTRNIGWVVLNVVVGSIVVGVLVFGGFLLLVVPGIFLAISFFFVSQEIAVNDENFVEAMGDSWRLVKGERIELFVLALALVVVSVVAGLPSVVLGGSFPAIAAVLGIVVSAPIAVFSTATAARAYVQLTDDREGGTESEADPGEDADDDEVGALGPDDIAEDHDEGV